jgi:hypothetical protein
LFWLYGWQYLIEEIGDKMEVKIIWLIILVFCIWVLISEFSENPAKRKISNLVKNITKEG